MLVYLNMLWEVLIYSYNLVCISTKLRGVTLQMTVTLNVSVLEYIISGINSDSINRTSKWTCTQFCATFTNLGNGHVRGNITGSPVPTILRQGSAAKLLLWLLYFNCVLFRTLSNILLRENVGKSEEFRWQGRGRNCLLIWTTTRKRKLDQDGDISRY
jgi:hypothetical protein